MFYRKLFFYNFNTSILTLSSFYNYKAYLGVEGRALHFSIEKISKPTENKLQTIHTVKSWFCSM